MRIFKNVIFTCFFCVLTGVAFFYKKQFSPVLQNDAICEILSTIPADEKLLLDYFFRKLLLKESGLYALTGTKAVAFVGYVEPEYFIRTLQWRNYEANVLMKKGHETWLKYQHLFPLTDHLLLHHEVDPTNHLSHIILINKNEFLAQVKDHLESFRAVLGPETTPQELLERLQNEQKSLYEILDNNSALEGIVLGFGKHNSWLFYQRDLLYNRNGDCQQVPKKINLIENRLNEINANLRFSSSENHPLFFVPPPCFLFDPAHPETQKLKMEYTQQRKEIANLYRDGNFLETTLRKLSEKKDW